MKLVLMIVRLIASASGNLAPLQIVHFASRKIQRWFRLSEWVGVNRLDLGLKRRKKLPVSAGSFWGKKHSVFFIPRSACAPQNHFHRKFLAGKFLWPGFAVLTPIRLPFFDVE